MKAQGKFGRLAVLAAATSLLSLSTIAAAETDAARAIRASAATVPTNIPGIHTYAEPPKGFNPVTATDVELATYGFPVRPDKQAHPNEYTQWERHMKLAKTRWNGELRALPGWRVEYPIWRVAFARGGRRAGNGAKAHLNQQCERRDRLEWTKDF